MPDTVIVGAGLTGLSLARRLAAEGQRPLVLEADDRVGGAVRTVRTAGLVIECGPQALRARPATLATIEATALQDRILPASAAAGKRYVLWDGKLRPVPRGLMDRGYVRKRHLLRALAEPFVPRRPRSEESVHAFFARRFGDVIADRIVDPIVAGIYAGDPHRIEVAAAFPELARSEARGVIASALASRWRERLPAWAPKGGFTLKGGVQSLVDTIAGALQDDAVRLGTPVERIERKGAGFVVHAPGGPYEAARVVVTVMPQRAATLVPELDPELAGMPVAGVASVHLAFKASEAPAPDGFGWLAPSSQRKDVLGVVWASSVYPSLYPGRTVLRVMIGGAREDVEPLKDEQLVLRARKVVAEVEGIRADPVFTHVFRARLPQYEIGHTARMERIRKAIPGLDLLGWAYTGLGIEGCLAASDAWR